MKITVFSVDIEVMRQLDIKELYFYEMGFKIRMERLIGME